MRTRNKGLYRGPWGRERHWWTNVKVVVQVLPPVNGRGEPIEGEIYTARKYQGYDKVKA